MKKFAILLTVIIAICACEKEKPEDEPIGKLLFTAGSGNAKEVYIVDAKDKNAKTLTSLPNSEESSARFSKGGKHIVFVSQDAGTNTRNIWLLKPGISTPELLVQSVGENYDPAWSNDGNRVAFVSTRFQNEEIFVINYAQAGQSGTQLTSDVAGDNKPGWSFNDSRIAFISERTGNKEVFVMKSNGDDQVNVSNDAAIDDDIVWSPVEDRMIIRSFRSGFSAIYIIEPDPPYNETFLAGSASRAVFEASWSPDGSKIAYRAESNGQKDVYTINSDGSGEVKLTSSGSVSGKPVWSPDGKFLAIVSTSGGSSSITIYKASGSIVDVVFAGAEIDDEVVWCKIDDEVVW